MDLSGPRTCGGCTATSEALPPAEIVRIRHRHSKDSGGKQFRSVAALFRAASTVVIAVDAIVRTRMGGGRARVSATIVPAKAFRRAAQARARDHGRPHDRWKAEGRDHDDPVILRGREHRAFSRTKIVTDCPPSRGEFGKWCLARFSIPSGILALVFLAGKAYARRLAPLPSFPDKN
jgi:hypothetical protein